jgi:hypothetical protein
MQDISHVKATQRQWHLPAEHLRAFSCGWWLVNSQSRFRSMVAHLQHEPYRGGDETF